MEEKWDVESFCLVIKENAIYSEILLSFKKLIYDQERIQLSRVSIKIQRCCGFSPERQNREIARNNNCLSFETGLPALNKHVGFAIGFSAISNSAYLEL